MVNTPHVCSRCRFPHSPCNLRRREPHCGCAFPMTSSGRGHVGCSSVPHGHDAPGRTLREIFPAPRPCLLANCPWRTIQLQPVICEATLPVSFDHLPFRGLKDKWGGPSAASLAAGACRVSAARGVGGTAQQMIGKVVNALYRCQLISVRRGRTDNPHGRPV